MRKVLLVTFLLACVAFSYNAFLGNRGTFDIYSGKCEDMGTITLGANTGIGIGDPFALTPVASLSFAPWHYLEFSVWGEAITAFNPALFEFLDAGAAVKGGVPIYFNREKEFYLAPGIAGHAAWLYPMETSFNAFSFGGLGLLTFNHSFFGIHLNGGYEYVTVSGNIMGYDISMGTGTVLGGAGLEVWPFKFVGVIVDGMVVAPQTDLGNLFDYFTVTPGLRLGTDGRVFKFNVNLGAKMSFFDSALGSGFFYTPFAGFGMGFDLMPPSLEAPVKGIVVDKATGKPIKGARVSIEGYSSIEPYLTDASGRFEVDQPKSALYTVLAQHPDYVPARVGSDVIESEGGSVIVELSVILSGATLVGLVSDADTEHPLSAFVRFVDLPSGKVASSLHSEPIAGFYRAEIPAGTYRVDVQASGYKKTHKSMILEDGDEEVVDFKLKPVPAKPPPPTVSFAPIYFGTGIYELSVQNYAMLKDVLEVLKTHPGIRVELQGHTDSVGDATSNYWLSRRRAETVRDFLVQRGISQDRIRVVGYGETRPHGDNRTRSGRGLNRRVDITVT